MNPHLSKVETDLVIGKEKAAPDVVVVVGAVGAEDGMKDGFGLEELGHVDDDGEQDDRHEKLEQTLPNSLGIIHGLIVIQRPMYRDISKNIQAMNQKAIREIRVLWGKSPVTFLIEEML